MAGFQSYDNIISALSTGNSIMVPYAKTCATAMTAFAWYSLFSVGGYNGVGTFGTTPSGCVPLSGTVDGSLYTGPLVTPKTKHLLNGCTISPALNGLVVMLVDQVAYYPINQSTSAQSFVNTNPPSRYVSGSESGLQVVLVNTATTGATSSNLTELGYIDETGASGQIDTSQTLAVTVSAAAPTAALGARVLTTIAAPFLPLGNGDCGVRRLTYCKFSAANTGLHAFMLVKPLAVMHAAHTTGYVSEYDFITDIESLPRIHDSASLGFIIMAPVTAVINIHGFLNIGWN